ncbi:MAG: hypothetical protein KBC06_02985, partial [Candidatus Pacebacteria bacterium]|nr:hypothetical protein [Candidatus Paceibacterota bacterium]
MFKNNNFKKYFFSATALLLIVILIAQTIATPIAGAATYTFNQTSWNGGASATAGTHPADQSSWDKYFSKDDNLAVVNSGAELQLSTTGSTLVQTDDGTTTTGFNLSGASFSNTSVSGTSSSAQIENSRSNTSVPMLTAGNNHTLALKSNGTVWAWGYNSQGQLGDGTTTGRLIPAQVSSLSGIIQIASGALFSGASSSYAVKSDGTAWSWGYNGQAQLGNGSTTQSNSPGQISGLSGITSIATGSLTAYAVKSDGSLWAWGANNTGQIGDNSTTQRYTPVRVIGPVGGDTYLSNVVSVATGGQHNDSTSTFALTSGGLVYAWGYNAFGNLGDATGVPRNRPALVSGITNVIAISAGSATAYALKSDGTVWAWGANGSGQTGNGTTSTSVNTPTQISGLSGITAIASGTGSGYALKSDGTVYSWGQNNQGQLGDGSSTQRSSPAVIGGLSGITGISAGSTHAFAIKSDGSVWGWGYNAVGQIGDNSTTQRKSPVRVNGESGSPYFAAGNLSYYTSGTYTSGVIDLGIQPVSFSTLSFTKTTPTSTTLTVDVRAGNSSNTSDGSWTSWLTNVSTGGDISSLGSHQYFQYRANLASSDDSVTPSLQDITIGYNTYPASQSLISSAYDSTDSINIIGSIAYDENESLPSGTGVIFSIRTAATQGGLTSASWSDFTNATANCSKTVTNVECSSSAIPSGLKDGSADRWWQYKVTLTSTGTATPTVYATEVTYVVNAPPELQNVTASQGTDGLVNISYDVRDSDTQTGSSTPGEVTPSFEYWNGTSWVTAITLSSGATTDKDVDDTDWSTYTATWNPKIDFNVKYITTAKIRVKVNDNEVANNLYSLESATFTLDTKNPVVNSFILDARGDASDNITIDVTEDTLSGLKMKISNNSDLSADGVNGT